MVVFLFLYSILAWAYIVLFFALVPLFAFPFSLIFGLKRSFRFFFKAFTKLGLAVLGWSPSVSGLDNIPREKPAILVSNHTSFLDPFILNAAFPGFLNFFVFAKLLDNYFTFLTLKFSGIIIRAYGHRLSGSKAIIRAINAIKDGDSFILFPSESVIPDGSIGKIKPGIYKIMEDADAVILPVHISGGISSGFLLKPGGSRIVIGKPIDKQKILYSRDTVIKEAISELN